jgi:hypothetical protein
LQKKIANLKKTAVANEISIREHERELNNLLDLEMRAELENYRHFDIIHNEQISPRFLALAKI